jgi:hypothetical protein
MHQHRFQHLLEHANQLPRAPEPQLSAAAFVVCPIVLMQAFPTIQQTFQYGLYQQALELAREMARPSIVERDLLGVWN